MARKNSSGKFIFSAGEVGAFTVCPESWRLKMIDKVKAASNQTESVERGRALHDEWARNYDEAIYLTRGAWVAVLLIVGTIIGYVIWK